MDQRILFVPGASCKRVSDEVADDTSLAPESIDLTSELLEYRCARKTRKELKMGTIVSLI